MVTPDYVEDIDNRPVSASGQLDPTIGFPVEIWETTRPTERAARIKKRLLENEREIDVERARYATESYRRTGGEPILVKKEKQSRRLGSAGM